MQLAIGDWRLADYGSCGWLLAAGFWQNRLRKLWLTSGRLDFEAYFEFGIGFSHLPAASSQLQAASSQLPAANCKPQAASCQLQAACRQLPVASYQFYLCHFSLSNLLVRIVRISLADDSIGLFVIWISVKPPLAKILLAYSSSSATFRLLM